MKKALVVSYVFPPMAAVGGQRVVGFCKYLPEFGWKPVVLTVKKGVNSSWDYSQLESVREITTYRSISFEPAIRRAVKDKSKIVYSKAVDSQAASNERLSLARRIKRFVKYLISVPDFAIFWIPFGIVRGLRVIRMEKISVIVSTSPPVSSHIIASILARITGLPHVADFRDLWTLNHVYHENRYPEYVKKYDRFWERFVLRGADWVTTASPGFTGQMKERFNQILGDRVWTITNGFDYGEIARQDKPSVNNDGFMRFLYAGSLYSQFNPVFFLESLADWLKNNMTRKVRCDFYGDSDYDYSRYAAELGLGDVVFFHRYKSRSELLPMLSRADCLLLFLGFDPSCANVIPAKLFEYMASGRPILALAPRGVTADIISRYEAGYAVTGSDKKTLIKCLDNLYDRGKTYEMGGELRYIDEFDKKRLTGRLAELLDRVAGVSREMRASGIGRKV